MHPKLESLFEIIHGFLEDNSAAIMVLIGIIFLVVGVLSFSMSTSLISVLSFFWGITMVEVGFLAKTGIITSNSSIKKKAGSALAIIAMFFFAGACVAFLFTEIGNFSIVIPFELHVWGPFNVHEIRFETIHPFFWLVVPLFSIGVCCLIFGLILKYR